MSQQEVRKLLKEAGQAMTRELLEQLNITQSALWQNLHRLEKGGEVEKKRMSKEELKERGYNIERFTGREVLWVFKNERR